MVTGNVSARYLYGNGFYLSGITTSSTVPTLSQVVNQGNTSSNTLQFTNTGVSLITSGRVGVSNTLAVHTLDVGSNLYVNDTGSNVLVVNGNVSTQYLQTSNALVNQYITIKDQVTPGSWKISASNDSLTLSNTAGGLSANLTQDGYLQLNGKLAGIGFIDRTLNGSSTYGPYQWYGSGGSVFLWNGVSSVANFTNLGYLTVAGFSSSAASTISAGGLSVTGNLVSDNVKVTASNPIHFTGPIGTNGSNVGLIEVNYNAYGSSTNPGDRYGITQRPGGILCTYISNSFTPGGFAFSRPNALNNGTFTDLMTMNYYGNTIYTNNLTTTTLFQCSNIQVKDSNGAMTFSSTSNSISLDHGNMSYKTFKIKGYTGTALKTLNFTNIQDGAQSIIDIYPRGNDIDVNPVISSTGATSIRAGFFNNVIINSASHCILSCVTNDGNTFVSCSEYY